MEDLLDLYAEPYDPRRPVVCFDETSTQLLADTRTSLPSRPGIPLRQDYEYRREGVRNLFLTCEPLVGLASRGGDPAAHHGGLSPSDALAGGRSLSGYTGGAGGHGQPEHAPSGIPVRDVPSSGGPANCQAAGVPLHPQARKLVESCPELVEGMAEIEFSVLSRSCLKQRLPHEEALRREVQALVTERNTAQATINWRFNTHDARTKLHRLYPFDSKDD